MIKAVRKEVTIIIVSLIVLSAISSLFIFTDISFSVKKIFIQDTNTKNLKSVSCIDPEQYSDYFIKGTVQVIYQNDITEIYGDACQNSSDLIEYYCKDNSLVKEIYNCLSGCFDGACINPQKIESVNDENLSNTCLDYNSISPINAISQNQYGAYSAINTIDYNLDTRWYGSPYESFPKWIYFDLEEKKCVNQFDLYFFNEELPITLSLQASQDAFNWFDVTGNITINSSELSRQDFPKTLTARYIRITEYSSAREYGSLSDVRFNVAKIPIKSIINQTTYNQTNQSI